MTLAGTRPPTVDEWKQYEPYHRGRLAVEPGGEAAGVIVIERIARGRKREERRETLE